MLTIILLNYNGWQDTIECLESLLKQTTKDWCAVIADNGSQDDSLEQLEKWIHTNKAEKQIRLLPLEENYGFAKGNNLAIEASRKTQTDYYWILNNDTVVEPDCLEQLAQYMETHPDITALTPAIRLYDQPDCLWNAGGRLVFGGRKYFGAYQPAALFEGKHELPITFITGCALLVRQEMVADKTLFTERFFFGEEDFDFSLRMQEQGKKMVCLLDAVMYHKVSATSNKVPSYNKLFIHTLNRAINLRQHYSPFAYRIWKMLYFPYTRWRFLQGMKSKEQRAFITLLRKEINDNECVNKVLFEKYIHYPFLS
jgi:hypothetical protein